MCPDSGAIANRREFLAYQQPVSFSRPGNNRPDRIVGTRRFDAIAAEFPDPRAVPTLVQAPKVELDLPSVPCRSFSGLW